MGRYLPISDHAVVGDLHTVALVGSNGTIDWLCFPRFDSPSIFGSILDADRGGFWSIAPVDGGWHSKQLYLPDTNVAVTRFLSTDGVGEVVDFMPVEREGAEVRRHRLIRKLQCVRGHMRFRIEVQPRFDYGREVHGLQLTEHGALFESHTIRLALQAPVSFTVDAGNVVAELTLTEGETTTFVLERLASDEMPGPYSEEDTQEALDRTLRFWRSWLSHSRYRGRWREMVSRSALTLKMLTYAPTGAIVAAPTTSLPEVIGGGRNWDYRYTWIRDAAFSLYGLLRLGFTEEAEAFIGWLTDRFEDRAERESGPLQIMYAVDGGSELPEEILDHLEGYEGSRPVRIGNGAAHQRQLDIYGELVDSVYLYNKYGSPISHQDWSEVTRIVEWVCEHWEEADEGIWEVRGGRKRFTYSRVMSWVAVERAIRMARQRGLPGDIVSWLEMRDRIYAAIMERGWNEARQAFVQHEETDVLDASLLLMPLVKFIAPTDPRWLSTLDRIQAELVSDSLVYRYNAEASPDGLEGKEGTFSMCSWWYVEALTRAGRLEEARLVFEKMLTYANHVGLYAEEIGPSGEQLGNFPQAFTHLALISAAHNLDRALG
jgi:GH15 family glucan-1,4-alpha-glucosidase